MGEYTGRVVAVTGAGSGIGEALAKAFASAGARVALLDIDGERAEANAVVLRDSGHEAIALKLDVAQPGAADAAAKAVEERFGACHVVCANVAVMQFGALDKLTQQDWAWLLSVNVMGTVNTVNAFLPLLRQGTGQRNILLTNSSSTLDPGERAGGYTATKGFLKSYGEILRLELAREDIGVSQLFPNGVATRHTESSMSARPQELGKSVLRDEDLEVLMSTRKIDLANVATPDHAVRNVLTDLRDNQPYIITHGDLGYKSRVEARHAEMRVTLERMLT